jgi:hypothetical protein
MSNMTNMEIGLIQIKHITLFFLVKMDTTNHLAKEHLLYN